MPIQLITPFLWFDHQAEEAAAFYASVFPNSSVVRVVRCGEAGPGPPGSALTVEFQLGGQTFVALNGGPHFKFTEAISFVVNCQIAGRSRYLLGKTLGRRHGRPVRLAEGPFWFVVADRSDPAAQAVGRCRSGEIGPGHEGNAGDEETRHCRARAGCRQIVREVLRPGKNR